MRCPWQASKQVHPLAGGRELVLCPSMQKPGGRVCQVCQVCRVCLWKVCIATFGMLLTFRASRKHGAVGTRELANG
ncbi:hypothetical protein KVR01_009218 [Diaporthe batatas]|uniref:uncharacterized protein n=1 Tax=Diaporthe batatas TaxID=748121 RepID=UPI001D03BE89|nr:uncharacterized protein KVR01_009218 [Diaporthe batatas]KAG8160954.1 hypothetical protein KVR01_009218 [Diaporthe batatas]